MCLNCSEGRANIVDPDQIADLSDSASFAWPVYLNILGKYSSSRMHFNPCHAE